MVRREERRSQEKRMEKQRVRASDRRGKLQMEKSIAVAIK